MDTRYSISVYTLPGEQDLGEDGTRYSISVYTLPGEQDLGEDGYKV